jgi:eukaryotic-like serine/threonine-protein kinase
MSAPSSVEELLQLIRKSGMVEDGKLNTYLNRRQLGRGLPADPREASDAMVADGLITNFQAEQFLLGKWRGFTIGKYKLLERVGVGGMGQVFLCEHMFMKKRVAIKVLPPAKAEQPAALGRFYREARAAGSLEHPNIVRTHDIDQDGNLHFIVMEYVDGSNLLDIVKKFGPLNIPRAVHYVSAVAHALEFAFKNGIIHRDVKPGNILVDRKGNTRILDMGLARFYNDTSDMLTVKYDDKIVLGTADYVAPEQVANSHSVDQRADIYALGATLYFLLAGHPPFPTGTVSNKLLWHRTKEPTPIQQIRTDIPNELAAIIAKMMAKDPNARYQTPSEVKSALAPYIPANVPLPTSAEMPQLCAAITETTSDIQAEVGTSDSQLRQETDHVYANGSTADVPMTQSRLMAAKAKANSTANPFGASAKPFGAGSGVSVGAATAARSPMNPPLNPPMPQHGKNSVMGRGNTTRPLENPTPPPPQPMGRGGNQPQQPAAQPNYGPPHNAYLNAMNSPHQPTAPTSPSESQRMALYVILAVSIFVGGGIIGWKVLGGGTKPVPAPIANVNVTKSGE